MTAGDSRMKPHPRNQACHAGHGIGAEGPTGARRSGWILLLTMLLATALVPGRLPAADASGLTEIPGLGSAAFPTSTKSAAAQHTFLRGLLLLHLFEYPRAKLEFEKAEALDPGFAMAYWGEAMTYNHPVWDQVDVAAGRAALEKLGATPEARAAKAGTAREKGYLAALDLLFWGKGTKEQRDAQYATAMKKLAASHPGDNQAQLFYALALLGSCEGVRDIPVYLKAAAIARQVFERNPQSPGAAHYWIHGMDDPEHAAGALVAARALSRIAPDAAHAQHMTSHIFTALGMWDEDVEANLRATSVVNREHAAAGKPSEHSGHYSFWLEYGYLEQGRPAAAREVLVACRNQALAEGKPPATGDTDPDSGPMFSAVGMWSRYILDTGDWSGPEVGWTFVLGDAWAPRVTVDFVRGFAAAGRHDVPAAEEALAAFRADQKGLTAELGRASEPSAENREYQKRVEILGLELEALLQREQGHPAAELGLLRQATTIEDSMPYEFGPPYIDKPPYELLGEELLRQKQPEAAIAALEVAIKRTPRRTAPLLALARAQKAAGETTAATSTFEKLRGIWHLAEPGFAGSREVAANLPRQ